MFLTGEGMGESVIGTLWERVMRVQASVVLCSVSRGSIRCDGSATVSGNKRHSAGAWFMQVLQRCCALISRRVPAAFRTPFPSPPLGTGRPITAIRCTLRPTEVCWSTFSNQCPAKRMAHFEGSYENRVAEFFFIPSTSQSLVLCLGRDDSTHPSANAPVF